MEHIFIINPKAGQGRAMELIPKIKSVLDGQNINYSVYETKCAGDSERFVKEACEKGKEARFYVCGGDGSLNEAVNGAKGFPETEIGVIPLGTGNDFVRNFPEKGFNDILSQIKGESVPCDVIEVNGRYVVNMVNIGFDCEVVVDAAKWKKKPFIKGTLAYVFGVGSVFIRPMGKHMSFRFSDGSELKGKFLLCSIANGCFCGGGFKSSPTAAVDDGLMDIGVVEVIPRAKFVRLLPKYKTGEYVNTKVGRENVVYKKCRVAEITVKEPANVSLDGEIIKLTKLKARNVQSAFKFIVPEK